MQVPNYELEFTWYFLLNFFPKTKFEFNRWSFYPFPDFADFVLQNRIIAGLYKTYARWHHG